MENNQQNKLDEYVNSCVSEDIKYAFFGHIAIVEETKSESKQESKSGSKIIGIIIFIIISFFISIAQNVTEEIFKNDFILILFSIVLLSLIPIGIISFIIKSTRKGTILITKEYFYYTENIFNKYRNNLKIPLKDISAISIFDEDKWVINNTDKRIFDYLLKNTDEASLSVKFYFKDEKTISARNFNVKETEKFKEYQNSNIFSKITTLNNFVKYFQNNYANNFI